VHRAPVPSVGDRSDDEEVTIFTAPRGRAPVTSAPPTAPPLASPIPPPPRVIVLPPATDLRQRAVHVNDFAAPGYPLPPIPIATVRPVVPPPSSLRPWTVGDPIRTPRVELPQPTSSISLSGIALTMMAFFVAMVCMGGFLFLQNGRRAAASAPPAAIDTSATRPALVAPVAAPTPPTVALGARGATAPAAASAALTTTPAAVKAPPRRRAPTPAARTAPATSHDAVAAEAPRPKPRRDGAKSVEEMLSELGDEQLRR
jgi:hypothetical protein